MGEDEHTAGSQTVRELRGDVGEPLATDVVQELAADDHVEGAGQWILGNVELQERDVVELGTTGARARERDLRQVGGHELRDSWSEIDREVPFGAPDLQSPLHLSRDQLERVVVLAALVCRLVQPRIASGGQELLEVVSAVCGGTRRSVGRSVPVDRASDRGTSDDVGRVHDPRALQPSDVRLTRDRGEERDFGRSRGGKPRAPGATGPDRRVHMAAEERAIAGRAEHPLACAPAESAAQVARVEGPTDERLCDCKPAQLEARRGGERGTEPLRSDSSVARLDSDDAQHAPADAQGHLDRARLGEERRELVDDVQLDAILHGALRLGSVLGPGIVERALRPPVLAPQLLQEHRPAERVVERGLVGRARPQIRVHRVREEDPEQAPRGRRIDVAEHLGRYDAVDHRQLDDAHRGALCRKRDDRAICAGRTVQIGERRCQIDPHCVGLPDDDGAVIRTVEHEVSLHRAHRPAGKAGCAHPRLQHVEERLRTRAERLPLLRDLIRRERLKSHGRLEHRGADALGIEIGGRPRWKRVEEGDRVGCLGDGESGTPATEEDLGDGEPVRRRSVGVALLEPFQAGVRPVAPGGDHEAVGEQALRIGGGRACAQVVKRHVLGHVCETTTDPRDPLPEIPVLACAKARLEAADALDCLALDQARVNGEDAVRREQGERVAVRDDRRIELDHAAARSHARPASVDAGELGILLERGEQHLERAGDELVVRVEEEQQRMAGCGNAAVTSGAYSACRLLEDLHARIALRPLPSDVAGRVRRAVIDDDRLPVGVRLRDEGLERARERRGRVPCRHDDRDSHGRSDYLRRVGVRPSGRAFPAERA